MKMIFSLSGLSVVPRTTLSLSLTKTERDHSVRLEEMSLRGLQRHPLEESEL